MNPIDILKQHSTQEIHEDEEQFVGFSLAKQIFSHRQFDAGISEISKLHQTQRLNKTGGGLLLTGQSGVGKSTLLEYYANYFPVRKEGNMTVIEVLKVTCPSSATAHGLVSAILDAMGYPNPSKTDLADKTSKVIKLLKMYQVELLLIDEFQHAYYSRTIQDFRQLIDTLKNILTISKVACVLTGLREADDVISTNEQVARRHSVKLELVKFQIEQENDFQEFRGILKAYEKLLPIPPITPLHDANLARRFIVATDGILDYLSRLLAKSVEIAGMSNIHALDLPIYALAFRTVIWKEVPDTLNPFMDKSPLRRLDKSGEPFYPWHVKHAIGSPLARRNLTK